MNWKVIITSFPPRWVHHKYQKRMNWKMSLCKTLSLTVMYQKRMNWKSQLWQPQARRARTSIRNEWIERGLRGRPRACLQAPVSETNELKATKSLDVAGLNFRIRNEWIERFLANSPGTNIECIRNEWIERVVLSIAMQPLFAVVSETNELKAVLDPRGPRSTK